MAFSLLKSWSCTGFFQNYLVKRHLKAAANKMEEIGSVEKNKAGHYGPGQCFIHRTFAYRGVVLCSWQAQLMDRDDKESPKIAMYYQVLIDERDAVHIRVETDVGKFLGKYQHMPRKNFRFADAGFDQVSHSDIIPFTPTSKNPIQHKMFGHYFVVRQTKGTPIRAIVPKMALHEWKRNHRPWLHNTHVHKMTTEKIRVTAMSLYMGKKRVTHWWRYCIRIENLNEEPINLQGQRWGIYTGNGELQTVRGIGILGNLPSLSAKDPAIQYCSHVTLIAPRGHMWGYYLVKKQKAKHTLLCPVPSFTLESSLIGEPITTK